MTGATSEWKTASTESVEAGACKAREQRRQRAGVGERYGIAVFSNWAAQGRAKHDRFVHRLLCAGVRGPATLAGTRELGHVHAHARTHTRVTANVSVVISWWGGIHLLALRLFGRYGCVSAFGLFKVEKMTRHAVRS